MKKIAFALVAVAALAGCTTAEQDTVAGGAIGAGVGALAGGTEGAIIGGAIGAGTGYFLGKATRTGWCRYRDRNGRIYEARCR